MALKIELASVVALTPLRSLHFVCVLVQAVLLVKRVAEKLFTRCSHLFSELERALSTVRDPFLFQRSFDHSVVMALRQGQPEQLVAVHPVKHLFRPRSWLRASFADVCKFTVNPPLLTTLQWR